jgi:thiol-disulfide isomerase/thioredoxin
MTRLRNNIFICAAVLAVVLFTGIAVQTASGAKVKRIDESALGKLITADDNRLVLTFMAAWCGPCIDELPALNKLHKRYRDRGFQIIGISIDLEGPGAMQPIVEKLKIEFPVYWCGEKAISKFNLNAIPMLLFIRRGEMVERLRGNRPEKFLDQKIREFLNLKQ